MWQSGKGPLQLVMAFEPFMKWGLDFMGLNKLDAKSTGNQYILVSIDYTTKWVESLGYCGKVLIKCNCFSIITQSNCPP
jgi:hypothetical protein